MGGIKETLSVQFSSGAQSCPTLCDPMNCSTPGLPVHHQSRSSLILISIKSVMPSNHLIHYCPLLLQPSIFPSMRVFSNESLLAWGGQSTGLLVPFPPALNLPQHQGLFQWVGSSHQVPKILELQLHYQSFQWILRQYLNLEFSAPRTQWKINFCCF